MSRILVIGAAGLLGQYLVEEAMAMGHGVLGTFKTTPTKRTDIITEHLDITNLIEVKEVFSRSEPDVVFLPSALTNVDYCETHPVEARQVNVEGTRSVASVCHSLGSKLVYISTDYVFDGGKMDRYSEMDQTGPLSVYARTKLDGEQVALEQDQNSVCRVSVLYGWNKVSSKSNFVTWAIGAMRNGNEIKLFGDQFVSPTYAPHCARALIKMVDRDARGLYHTSGPDCIDRYSMGMMIAEAFNLNPSLCRKIRTEDLPLPAKRCKNSCLDVSKFEREVNIKMLPLAQGLRDMRLREAAR